MSHCVSAPSRSIGAEEMAGIPLFDCLDESGRELVLRVARVETPPEGGCVQFADSPMSRLVIVLSGGLRVVHNERGGHAQIVRMLSAGDHLGETELLLRRRPAHSAYALPGTTLCSLPHADVHELSTACPALVLAMLAAATDRLLETESLLSSMVADDVLTRLALYLLRLPGGPDTDGTRRVRLPCSQADVASLLGTTPETLSRRMRDLIAIGALERVAPGEFTLDAAVLDATVREQS